MSEQSGGPGWWQASDGKWYPPEQATTAAQPPVDPTTTQPAYGAPMAGAAVAGAPVAGAAAAGGGGAGKIIAIVVVLALLAGGGAFLLTKGSGGGRSVDSFCTKAKAAQKNVNFDDITDPRKVDALVSAFDDLAKSAPDEIKSDMDALSNAIKRERDNVKAGKSLDEGFSSSDEARLTTASANINKFAKDKCGIDLNSSSSDASSPLSSFSFDTSSFSSSLSSDFSSFDSDSFSSSLSSEAEKLCSQFGTDFGSDFCS
ncbi:MAG: hypothetical protein QOG30_11, partial [Acidimicrobiaceae bacterium]